MKIAFITNYEKTIYFHRIAARLETIGHAVSWISPSGHWARWLAAQSTPASAILDLSTYGESWRHSSADSADDRRLAELEARAGLRLNDLVLMDRILRTRPAAMVRSYLAVASREIERFLVDRDIAVVFGEQTFGVELLTSMICRAQHRALLVPHVVRVPTNRMGFFRGHLQAELVPFRDVTQEHRASAARFLAEFRQSRPRPEYFHRYSRAPAPRASWPLKLVKHLKLQLEDPFDETHFSPAWLVKKRASEVINALAHRIEQPFWLPPQPARRPFVLFPLHRQPEASIDVLGSRTSNQTELVRALARTLPVTHDLYVKEHPNGLGDRSPAELRALRDIPSVRLIDPGVSSFALAETAELVITVSGTAAYEAALLGRPAATIANMFFGEVLVANAFNPYEQSLSELLDQRTLASDDTLVTFLAYVLAQSFPGRIDNPLFAPDVLEESNLDEVARGFSDLLASGGCGC